jgi:hypothetical protein
MTKENNTKINQEIFGFYQQQTIRLRTLVYFIYRQGNITDLLLIIYMLDVFVSTCYLQILK